jgi:hypothetical protein
LNPTAIRTVFRDYIKTYFTAKTPRPPRTVKEKNIGKPNKLSICFVFLGGLGVLAVKIAFAFDFC